MNTTPLPRVRPIPFGRLLVALLLLLPLPAVADESAVPEGVVYELPENPDELLRVDDEMRAFFEPRIPHTHSVERRIDAIVEAVLGENGLHFRYEANGLYDVRETFRRRAGNCVSYSMLIVAVAREFRIPAEFNEVNVRPRWNRAGKLVLRTGHINVRVPESGGDFEIDLKMMANFRASGGMARAVNDARAFSSMYTSAGVFRWWWAITPAPCGCWSVRCARIRVTRRLGAISAMHSGSWAGSGTRGGVSSAPSRWTRPRWRGSTVWHKSTAGRAT